MVEELEIEEPQLQEQDPPSKKRKLYDVVSKSYDLGTYDDFDKKLQDPNSRKKFYDVVGKEFDLGTYQDFELKITDTQKKNLVGKAGLEKSSLEAGNSLTPSNGVDGSEIPTIALTDEEAGIFDPITQSLKIKELSNRTKEVSVPSSGKGGQLLTTVPDEDAREQAKLQRKAISDKGYDPDKLAHDFDGIENLPFNKQELLDDYKNNPQVYERKLGRLKWKSGLDKELNNAVENGSLRPDEYDNLQFSIQSSLENSNVGDYKQQRGNVNSVANAIKTFGGKNKDKLLAEYATEISKVYGNSYKNGFDKAISDTPESKYLTPDAQLGYQYIQDLSPEKAEQYKRLLIDKATLKDKPDELRGYNHLMQTLEETGLKLQKNAVEEDLNQLYRTDKGDGVTLTPENQELGKQLKEKFLEIEQKENELDKKYPERVTNNIDDAIQEIFGQRIAGADYVKFKLAQSVKSTAKGVWEAVSTPFMSNESNSLRELAILGESIGEENFFKVNDKNKAIQRDQMIFQPELQKQIDAIKNSVLSESEKQRRVTELLKNNPDDYGRVPIQNGRWNLNASSILTSLSDLGTGLLPFVALEAATGGIGGAGAAAKFLRTFSAAAATTFHDEYATAIKEGRSGTDAYKRALSTTAINSLAMAGAGTPTAIRELAKGNKSYQKIIAQMSDDEIQKVLSSGTPKGLKAFGQSFIDRAKATPEMIEGGLKTGAKFEVYMAGANAINDREVHFKEMLLNTANFGILGGVLGHTGYKSPTELQKSYGLDFAKKPEDYISVAERMKKDGLLSETDFNHRKDLIERYAEAYKALPKADSKSVPLSEQQKSEYLYNTVIKNENNKAKSSLPPKQAEKAELAALVADHKNDLILEPKTEKQLESRKSSLEKSLEKKDDTGKLELNDKERKDAEAELQAVNDTIEKQSKVYVEEPRKVAEEVPLEENNTYVEPPKQIPEPITIGNETKETKVHEPSADISQPEVIVPERVPETGAVKEAEPPKPPKPPKDTVDTGDGMKDLDKLANNVPDSGKVAEYMSKETIEKYTGEEPTNDQRRGVQELNIALEHGEKIVEKAQELFGKDYAEKTLDYIDKSSAGVSNKALMYVSLENALGKEKLAYPERAAELTKQQALVYEQSQKFARENSLALNYQKLRRVAKVGYDMEKITDNFFSAEELAAKKDISKAIEADADTVNKEAERQETGDITPDIERQINEGVAKEIEKIYEKLPKEKKTAVDKAIAALESVQTKLRSKTYDATLGIPVAVIDLGITTIKLALKAGVKIADAVELGIAKIKDKYGKPLEKSREDEIRKDLTAAFSKIKTTKDIVKEALIEKGFGREVEVKGVKKKILDWKKLAGAAGTVSKISENVADVLKGGKFSEKEIEAIKDDLVNEYIDLRTSVIEKSQNELAKRNKENVSADQKSAAKKLAELYTYGLFEKNAAEFETAINKAIGVKVTPEGFNEAKEIAKSMETIFNSTFKGVKLSDISGKAALEKLEDRMRVILFREARKQGNNNLGMATFVRNYFELQQTLVLNNLKQAVENPFSGLQQSVIDKISSAVSKDGSNLKALNKQRRQIMKDVYKDMVLHGGVGYGKVESTFVNRQHIDDYINKMSDSQVYHGIMAVATGKTTLNAMDAMWKVSMTEKKFAGNLIKVLTHETNKNRMTPQKAQEFVAEKLTGQTLKDATKTATDIINTINKEAGKELIPTHPEQVSRFANDIVKASLEMGNKISADEIQSAYNAAYRSAGLNLGHTANNFLSAMIHGQSAKIEGALNQALKQKEWDRAALLTYYSVFYRNILNPFVGGGTNWLVLKFEKTGLGLLTGLAYKIGTKTQLDLSTERGQKLMEERLYNQSRIKDNFMRGVVGGLTSATVYASFLGIAGTEDYRRWRGNNRWAARYLDVVTPEHLLAHMSVQDKTVKKYVSSSLNKNDAFDASLKVVKAADYAVKGESGKAWGALGEALGSKFNTPLPWRLVRDGKVIYQGVTGQDPYHGNYKASEGFLSGVLQGGFIEWLGARPLPDPSQEQGKKKAKQQKKPKKQN